MAEAELEPETEEVTEELAPESAEESTESEEVEVVLAGDAPEPEMIPKAALTKRAARYVRKIDAQKEVIDQQSEELEQLRAKAPKPEDFDYDEERYKDAQSDHNAKLVEAAALSAVKRVQGETAAEAQARESEAKQVAELERHYERAETLKVPDYETSEDSATEAMGENIIAEIARGVPNSELVIYYLGKHPVEAKKLADTMRSNPFAGTVQLGELAGKLTAQPKSNTPPDPVDPVEGGVPGTQAKWDKKLKAAYAEANKIGNMSPVQEVRRLMSEANVS